MDSENDDETVSSDCSCPPLTSSSQSDDETVSSDSSRPPLMEEDYQYETYIFKLMGDYQYDTYIFKWMMLDRQLIRETSDSWATFNAIDDSA